jgi:hypothetical protein
MNAATDQTETLLLDLERRARVLQDCSEKLETQLKVMLVLQSRGQFPNDLVARIAHALAICLSSRGDGAQAGQYAMMAANLERGHYRSRSAAGGPPVRATAKGSDTASSVIRDRTEGLGPSQALPGPSSGRPRRFDSLWSAWLAFNRRTAKRLGR